MLLLGSRLLLCGNVEFFFTIFLVRKRRWLLLLSGWLFFRSVFIPVDDDVLRLVLWIFGIDFVNRHFPEILPLLRHSLQLLWQSFHLLLIEDFESFGVLDGYLDLTPWRRLCQRSSRWSVGIQFCHLLLHSHCYVLSELLFHPLYLFVRSSFASNDLFYANDVIFTHEVESAL